MSLLRSSKNLRLIKFSLSNLQDAVGKLLVRLHAGIHLIDLALVYHGRPVLADADLEAIQRARGGPFEVESGLKKTAAVTGALELVFGRLPARRASQMGAFSKNRIDARFLEHDPNPLFLLVCFYFRRNRLGERDSCFAVHGRLEKIPGKGGANKT